MRLRLGLLCSGAVALATGGAALAQETATQPLQPPQQQISRPSGLQGADWRQQLANRHDPRRAIDEELSRLTRDLQLTPEQVAKVTPMLHEHQDRIQALLDQNPSITREAYQTQVHAISRETHNQINSLLTEHQLQLMTAMVGRLGSGQESRHAR
jgi:septal ring factor EnvC (AmiA/AmiB activator)